MSLFGAALASLLSGINVHAQSHFVPASFYPRNFSDMGDIALIDNTNGISGGELYTIINTRTANKHIVAVHNVMDHVLSATFSPDGAWLWTRVSSGNSATPWIVSANGRIRYKLAGGAENLTWLAQGHTLIFSRANKIYKMTPGSRPVIWPIHLPRNSVINGLAFSAGDQNAAVSITRNYGNISKWYDQIGVWNRLSGAWRPMVTASVPNGLMLGPFAGNGQSLFYWNDPMHSASILADGVPLHNLSLNGKNQVVGHTFATNQSVQPFGADRAVVWQSHSRYLFAGPKTIAIWPDATIPVSKGSVQLDPALSSSGVLAYVVGKEENNMIQSNRNVMRWMQSLKLATYNPNTRKTNIITTAGNGVMTPYFSGNGSRIVFVRQNEVMWVNVTNRGLAHLIAKTGAISPGSPQYGSPNAFMIADDLAAPQH